MDFNALFDAIKADKQNQQYTSNGINPLYFAAEDSRIVVIGQAPGRIAQESGITWNDRSGDRLRDWMGIDRDTFYNPHKIAIIPMDFYFPGTGKSGDLPPRKGFAEKWHPLLLSNMPEVRLTILVGSYATKRYLKLSSKDSLTSTVRNFENYLPTYFPLVHPSPRNQLWMSKNPWFETEVLPRLRKEVQQALCTDSATSRDCADSAESTNSTNGADKYLR